MAPIRQIDTMQTERTRRIRRRRPDWLRLALILWGSLVWAVPSQAGHTGYYRDPALHGEDLVFTSEGDLWRVGIEGGLARRLTSHHGHEGSSSISPDGASIAFTGSYEGPSEVYLMPAEGGLPRRLTWNGTGSYVVGWSPDRRILYTTSRFSTLPSRQLVILDPLDGREQVLPLAQASEGCYDSAGRTLFFTRFPEHGSHTKRYRGGMAQDIWSFAPGDAEARVLTADHPGTDRSPMFWDGRVYFVSDRDGDRNIWSMDPEGLNLLQHTYHKGWDVKSPSLSQGRIAYQLGADIRVLDLGTGEDAPCPIELASDLDQMREIWVDKPMDYLTAAHPSPDGSRVVLTARGQVFTAPARAGRLVRVTRDDGVRYRDACFLAGGETLLALSDRSGEVEFVRLPADGLGEEEALTSDGTVLRFDPFPSPDGSRAAYTDKDRNLYILNLETAEQTLVATARFGSPFDPTWSPDSRRLAYVVSADNMFDQIMVFDVEDGRSFPVTSDRFDSYSPAWDPKGEWLYFLSDRHLESLVRGVWGPRQPEPFIDSSTGIYAIPLLPGLRSPFRPPDELHEEADGDEAGSPSEGGGRSGSGASGKEGGKEESSPVRVEIERDGIVERVGETPIPRGNYRSLAAADGRLLFLSGETGSRIRNLQAVPIQWDDPKPETLIEDVSSYELTADGKTLLVRQGDNLHLVSASTGPSPELDQSRVDLSSWGFPLDPKLERRQMFVEAWRLERDYFYDPGMHGVDWDEILQKYLPLVDRVTDRRELNDLLGEMISELSALHMFVWGGDIRSGDEDVRPASLGARLARDEKAGGYRVAHIYQTDPDLPEERSPLVRPGVDLRPGDLITAIDGVPVLDKDDPAAILRNKAGQQVLLQVRRVKKDGKLGAVEEAVVEPVDMRKDWDLRYDEWEYTRRLMVEDWSGGMIGYVHLRSMGSEDFSDWAREFYPVHRRRGLIVDVRNNTGGNIDSWILSRLQRRAWMWWKPRKGEPYPNMQHAFGGHMAVLCNEATFSDGEAFVEGFRRLGLGPVIGTRTTGGEIWLSFSNHLVDGGIASAAESGVYGPEGEWLIEGYGVVPDIVVDNPPHAAYNGEDAQLRTAVEYLLEQIRTRPVEVPPPPPYPDKSGRN